MTNTHKTLLVFSLCVMALLIFTVAASNGKNNSHILTQEDLLAISGGCSGGECKLIEHTCPWDSCTKLEWAACSGGVGNCSDDFYLLTCRCDNLFFHDPGCM